MDSDPTRPLRRADESKEELECKERTRQTRAILVRVSVSLVVFASLLLLRVRPAGTAVASDGTRYWTGWGILLLESAAALLILAGASYVASLSQTDSQVEAKLASKKAAATWVESTKDLQLDNDDLGMYRLDTLRWCKALMFGSRLLLNVFFVGSTFARLPPRDPHERLNEAKYFVSEAEVVGLSIFGMVMAFRLCHALLLAQRLGAADDQLSDGKTSAAFGSAVSDLARSANAVATFSAVSYVASASPAKASADAMRIAKRVKLSSREGATASLITEAVAAGITLLSLMLYATLGMLALLVKVNQIGLFTEAKFSPELLLREPVECLTFLGFVVAIGSANTDRSKLEGILAAATSGEEEINQEEAQNRIKGLVCAALCRKQGLLKGLACVLTLSPEMYTEVVFTRRIL